MVAEEVNLGEQYKSLAGIYEISTSGQLRKIYASILLMASKIPF